MHYLEKEDKAKYALKYTKNVKNPPHRMFASALPEKIWASKVPIEMNEKNVD